MHVIICEEILQQYYYRGKKIISNIDHTITYTYVLNLMEIQERIDLNRL